MGSSTLRKDLIVLAPVAAAAIGLHFIVVNNYGIFRDELYYLACGRHVPYASDVAGKCG